MKNIAILTSGGDSPGMNACVRAVVRYGISKGMNVYGVSRGYSGLIDGNIKLMNERSVGNIIQTGGTILKTSRSPEFKTEIGRQKAINNLKKHKIEGLVVIGGDGTFKGANELIKLGIVCACIPATIDNNLFYTDYTIGFDTARNTVVNMLNNIRDTSYSHDRITLVETMGAGCGDIALSAGLAAGADAIIVPEIEFNIDDICDKLIRARAHEKEGSIVVVSEHVCNLDNLAKVIQDKCNVECRTVNLGHIQRGGSPTAFDRNLATKYGVVAVDEILKGDSGVVGYKNGEYIFVSIEKALLAKQEFNISDYMLAEKLSF